MKLLVLACLVLYSFNSSSEDGISGFIYNKSTGATLAHASIIIEEIHSNKKLVVSSNENGFYSISANHGTYLLSCSLVGYTAFKDTITIDRAQNLDIYLGEDVKQLDEITITEQKDVLEFNNHLSSITVPQSISLKMPRFAGEADIMKTLQFLPGVSQGAEGSSGLYVRGGDPGQNLILIDGVPVYNYYHIFGFLSTINPEAVSHMQVYKGGVSGRYEGRLSSVIDISLKDGNRQESKKSISLSPIAGTFYIEGPIKKDKASFIFAGRRTWLDALVGIPSIGNARQTGYNFHDLSGKVKYDPSNNHTLNFATYHSRDKFYDRFNSPDFNSDFSFKWKNLILNASHVWKIKPELFLNSAISSSDFAFDRNESLVADEEQSYREISTSVRDITAKSMAQFQPAKSHKLSAGIELTRRVFEPRISQSFADQERSSVVNNYAEQTHMISLFAEDIIHVNRFEILGSIRQTFYTVDENSFSNLQPHALLSYSWPNGVSLKCGYDNITQYVHLLTSSQLGQPTDIWVPATKDVPPSKSNQYMVGSGYDFKNGVASINVEAYWKEMDGVIEFKDGASFIYSTENSWEDKVAIGKGEAYGIEFLISKNKGKLTGWVAYTLAKSNRLFDDLNSGKVFPYKYDRTHVADFIAMYTITERSSISTTFSYRTGNALTLPVATYESADLPFWPQGGATDITFQSLKENRNNYRMPNYHRLDISYQNTKKLKKNRERTWAISIYNVYNRLNLYFIYEKEGKFRQYALFPIIPSISYKYSF